MTIAYHSSTFLRCERQPGARWPDAVWVLLFLVVSILFLFVDPKRSPVALQDEARNAINALEMYLTGPSLVTTFNFQPDLWNTKPPLLIWLMSGSMGLFGPSEWAIRLPSALAALGILLSTILFTRRLSGSLPLALTAAALLLLSPGFFGEHGARTADYDATLTFFVTVALQLIFFAVHRARPSIASLALIGALVGAAALTKSVAAFIPIAGVVVYLLAVGRLKRVLSLTPRYALAVFISVVPLLTFYALREAAGPGYISAVLYNDLTGRFSETQIRDTGPFFYLTNLTTGWFVAGPFLLGAPLVLRTLSGRTRLMFIYAASIVGFSLLVYSAASNRALQYALPMFPWLAILGALTLRHFWRMVDGWWSGGEKRKAAASGAAMALAGLLLTYQSLDWRYRLFPERDFYAQSSYGDLFGALAERGVTQFTVIDPGNRHFGKTGYAPLLRWNRLIWEEKGLRIAHELDDKPGIRGPLATCQPTIAARWPTAGKEMIGQCAVLWPAKARPLATPAQG